jgi:16S rRNA (adenine1518-N6/adenine1519-N6)-dimethyltransferase
VRDARALLRKAGLAPKKSFGQNFLVSEGIARSIAAACVPDDEVGRARVVEIGAGAGALTSLLVPRASHVSAIERDRDLIPVLSEAFAEECEAGRLSIVEGDAQTVDLDALLGPCDPTRPRVLCGNLPYQITGRLLQRATAHAASLERAVFMVQAEVADRLVAEPGTKEYGALTVFVRAAFDVRRLLRAPPGAFFPSPDVTSAVVVLTRSSPPRALETPQLREVVKAAFATRRKTLRNAWRGLTPAMDVLERAAREAEISLDARGETLDVTAFARFAAALELARESARDSARDSAQK